MSDAYACVYRQYFPSPIQLRRTETAAASNPALASFLEAYTSGNSFYDWGDDPAFFAATHFQGSPSFASWGVCRPDVRSRLKPGDLIAFFCAKRINQTSSVWNYFYSGAGTVHRRVDRDALWKASLNREYRRYFNVLTRPVADSYAHNEFFSPPHEDWLHRSDAGYIVFDPALSKFNLVRPLHVATFSGSVPEHWLSRGKSKVATLEKLLFTAANRTRRLRTSHQMYAHAPLRLVKATSSNSGEVELLRRQLLNLV